MWMGQAAVHPIALGALDLLRGLGVLFSFYFCVKETWLALVSIFPNRPVFPDCLCNHQLIHPSIQSLSYHILVQCLKWARTLTIEAALVFTFTNMGFVVQGQDT